MTDPRTRHADLLAANAWRLLDDAELLLENCRFPSAEATAELAKQEAVRWEDMTNRGGTNRALDKGHDPRVKVIAVWESNAFTSAAQTMAVTLTLGGMAGDDLVSLLKRNEGRDRELRQQGPAGIAMADDIKRRAEELRLEILSSEKQRQTAVYVDVNQGMTPLSHDRAEAERTLEAARALFAKMKVPRV